PENPGECGGDADRAGAVAADMDGRDPGGAGRGGAGAAAPGGMLAVPPVAGYPGQRRVAERLPAEFGCCRLAEDHRSGLAQPRHRRTILRYVLLGLDETR